MGDAPPTKAGIANCEVVTRRLKMKCLLSLNGVILPFILLAALKDFFIF